MTLTKKAKKDLIALAAAVSQKTAYERHEHPIDLSDRVSCIRGLMAKIETGLDPYMETAGSLQRRLSTTINRLSDTAFADAWIKGSNPRQTLKALGKEARHLKILLTKI